MINLKKLQLTPVKEIEFSGLVINSVNMTSAFPQEKVPDIQNKCTQLIASPKNTIMELTKLLGKLPFRHCFEREFSAGTCNNNNKFRQ